jgi:CHAT domain-containing protein
LITLRRNLVAVLLVGGSLSAQLNSVTASDVTFDQRQSEESSEYATKQANVLSLEKRASAFMNADDYKSALPLLIEALHVRERYFGNDDLDFANLVEGLAVANYELSQYTDALSWQLRALQIRKSSVDSTTSEIALSLSNLGRIYLELGQHKDAISSLAQALTLAESAVGPEHPDLLPILTNLGWTHYVLGEYPKARSIQERGLLILERHQGSNLDDMATSLTNLGLTYLKLSQYEEALSLQLQALLIVEHLWGAGHPSTATVLNNLGLSYETLGRHADALPVRQRVLEIRESALGKNHLRTANAMANLASTKSKLGDYAGALLLQRHALNIREQQSGVDHPETARALSNLAVTHFRLAEHDEAIVMMQKALRIREASLGENHPDVAVSLGGLASMYSALGQYEKALSLERRAYAIRSSAMGPDHQTSVISLNNMAWLHHELEQYDEVLPLRVRILSILEKTLGTEHELTAAALGNLGRTYVDLGSYKKALSLQLHALAIRQRVLGKDHPDTATALKDLGFTYSKLGDERRALDHEILSLAIFEGALGADHPRTALARARVGLRLVNDGSSDLALALLKSAVNSLQDQRQRVARIGQSELATYSSSLFSTYQEVADAFVRRGRISEAQYILEMLKEEEHFEYLRRSPRDAVKSLVIGFDNSERSWIERYVALSERLKELRSKSKASVERNGSVTSVDQAKPPQSLPTDFTAIQSELLEHIKQIRRGVSQQSKARVIEIEQFSAGAVREAQNLIGQLGDDVALLQYYLTDRRVGMLLTTANTQIAKTRDINIRELNRTIADFRRALQDPRSNPKLLARQLYEVLIAPIEADLGATKVKTLMLSLDGSLRYLPFTALHDGKEFLLNRWRMPIYTSVTRSRLADRVSVSRTTAAMGVSRAWPEFEALGGVLKEVQAVVNNSGGGTRTGEIYLDERFTADQLRHLSKREFFALHIASHFRFSPGTEINSFLLLGDGQRLTIGDIRASNIRFSNIDLLTLSACETGLGGGRDERGREIEGFGVVAQQQGAKSVLATLWKVSDNSTATLMEEFYRRRYSGGLQKIEALTQAQLKLLKSKQYSHPFHWAPFILMGNWK